MKVYTIYAHDDLGINNNIYANYGKAFADVEEALDECGRYTIKEALDCGYVSIRETFVIMGDI